MTLDLHLRPRRRPLRLRAKPKPPLRVAQILAWADSHRRRTGSWPTARDGYVGDAWDTTWKSIDKALRAGCRGLTGGSSLARLLSERRGVRNHKALPPYRLSDILTWADAHRRSTGSWPNHQSGPIQVAAGETWNAVENALRAGTRGLKGGTSLAQLLARYRGVRNRQGLPRLTIPKILGWADAHFKRTGRWPNRQSGAIPAAPGENWRAINAALQNGYRALPGGGSLAQLLDARRGVRNRLAAAPYTLKKILAWADAHRRRSGRWPRHNTGPVVGAPGETWQAVNSALSQGTRGLPGGTSLARLLQRRRGARHRQALPPLRLRQILSWARAYRDRTGALPTRASGPVAESPGDTWTAIEMALRKGRRGLSGGLTLASLLKARLAVPKVGTKASLAAAGSRKRSMTSLAEGRDRVARGERASVTREGVLRTQGRAGATGQELDRRGRSPNAAIRKDGRRAKSNRHRRVAPDPRPTSDASA